MKWKRRAHDEQRSSASIPDPDVSSTGAVNTATIVPDSEEEQRRQQIEKNQAAIRLLESWREGDEQEQRETWEALKKRWMRIDRHTENCSREAHCCSGLRPVRINQQSESRARK